jgi:hypothetical protein
MTKGEPEEARMDEAEFNLASQRKRERGTVLDFAESLNEGLLNLLQGRSAAGKSADELFKERGPLATFAARIDAAHAFGLITDSERRELDLIRQIRNAFAHVSLASLAEISFNQAAVRVRCLQLAEFPLDLVREAKAVGWLRSYDPASPRDRFTGACIFHWVTLKIRRDRIERVRAPEPIALTDLSGAMRQLRATREEKTNG